MKFSTTASASAPAVKFRSAITQDPAVRLVTYAMYAAAVAPLLTWTDKTSLAPIRLFVNVKVTAVLAASDAAFMVMRPMERFSVTPVLLSVACVTVPCAAVV